jgi:uncharacterized protein (TIGR00255 family)
MHSMTGFGRGSAGTSTWQATIEIASVNRKQAEVVVQAPRELASLEASIRREVLAVIARGRVQVSVHLERPAGVPATAHVNVPLAEAFESAFEKLGETLGREVLPSARDFLRQPGIVSIGVAELDPESAWPAIAPALSQALDQLAAMRAHEGEHLKSDILTRLALLEEMAARITETAPQRPIRQRELLTKRLREAGLDLDISDERVIKELALFADRCDISEEVARIASHFAKFREYLDAAEPPGRALDFLCQELFREFNTIGSKANDAGLAQLVVEAKTELEKIREQAQNVE